MCTNARGDRVECVIHHCFAISFYFHVFDSMLLYFPLCRYEEFPKGKHNIHQRFYQEFNAKVEKFLLSTML